MIEAHVKILDLCERYYDKETFAHAKRVYHYVTEGPWGVLERNLAAPVALLHDILEDTSCSIEEVCDVLKDKDALEALFLLTKRKGMKYVKYCKIIKEVFLSGSLCGKIAWIVKLADMKDHLSQKDTLTDRLKEKYLAGLAELL